METDVNGLPTVSLLCHWHVRVQQPDKCCVCRVARSSSLLPFHASNHVTTTLPATAGGVGASAVAGRAVDRRLTTGYETPGSLMQSELRRVRALLAREVMSAHCVVLSACRPLAPRLPPKTSTTADASSMYKYKPKMHPDTRCRLKFSLLRHSKALELVS